MRRRIVITHFYNEAYLLPWWLAHHVPLFEHGILIDYHSSDQSREICHRLAPHWEIRESRNEFFEAASCDKEVMDIEREFTDCWKLALNTTEFFCPRDIEGFFWSLEQHGWQAYALRGVVLNDPPSVAYGTLDPSRPLVAQRWHGYFEDQTLIDGVNFLSRNRLLHRAEHGHYQPGRHWSSLTPYMHPPGALLIY